MLTLLILPLALCLSLHILHVWLALAESSFSVVFTLLSRLPSLALSLVVCRRVFERAKYLNGFARPEEGDREERGEGMKERAACGISFEGGIHTCHTWAPSQKSREEP